MGERRVDQEASEGVCTRGRSARTTVCGVCETLCSLAMSISSSNHACQERLVHMPPQRCPVPHANFSTLELTPSFPRCHDNAVTRALAEKRLLDRPTPNPPPTLPK